MGSVTTATGADPYCMPSHSLVSQNDKVIKGLPEFAPALIYCVNFVDQPRTCLRCLAKDGTNSKNSVTPPRNSEGTETWNPSMVGNRLPVD